MPKDACYRKVKARYRVFPSAYASGAIANAEKLVQPTMVNQLKRKLLVVL